MITGWIQSSDFSSRELGDLTVEQAIAHFQNHNWIAEIELDEQLVKEGKESCPAGIGFNLDQNVLHICPETENNNIVFFNFQEPKKILGVIPSKSQVSESKKGVSDEACNTLIKLYFSGDLDLLKNEICK